MGIQSACSQIELLYSVSMNFFKLIMSKWLCHLSTEDRDAHIMFWPEQLCFLKQMCLSLIAHSKQITAHNDF